MGSTSYSIPIRRRHEDTLSGLKAVLTQQQEWGYVEDDEQLVVVLSDGTSYRAMSRYGLMSPGSEATVVARVTASDAFVVGDNSYAGDYKAQVKDSDYEILQIESSLSGDSSTGVRFRMYLSGSIGSTGVVSQQYSSAKNSADEEINYGTIECYSSDTTDSSEDSRYDIKVWSGGSEITALSIGADVNTEGLTGYADTSSITGFSSYTEKEISYKKLGKTVKVWFHLEGPAELTTTSFTLPYGCTTSMDMNGIAMVMDNSGTPTVGRAIMTSGSNSLQFYSDVLGTGWTASGNRMVKGYFTYETS